METSVRQALDDHLKRFLRPLFWSLSGIYATIATAWALGARADVPPLVAAFWTMTGASALVGAVAVARPNVNARWAHPALLVIVLMALNNVVWLIGLTHNFVYTSVLYLILLGSAILFLSLRYFLVVAVGVVASWLGLVMAFGANKVWVEWGFTLFAGVVVAILAQVMRVRTYTRLEEFRRSETARVRHEEELRRTQALAADRTRVLNLTAHEIATPLTPIFLRLRALVAEEEKLSSNGIQAIRSLERNFNRLHASMQDVLAAVASPKPSRRVMQDSKLLMEEAAKEAQKVTRASVRVGKVSAQSVHVDPDAVTHTIRRLVQFTDRRLTAENLVELSAQPVDGHLEVRISDDGPFIPTERAVTMFEPWGSAYDPMAAGKSDFGLSLHIAKQQVAEMGGLIWHEPRAATGAVLAFRIPA